MALFVAKGVVHGGELPTSEPSSRPALEELDRETRALYRSVQGSLIRVQMPQPQWVNQAAERDRDTRFEKYRLNADVRRQLLQQQPQHIATTRPAEAQLSQGGTTASAVLNEPGMLIVVPPTVARQGPPASDANDERGGDSRLRPAPADADPKAAYNNLGLLLDADGHVLVPLYLEREAAGAQPIAVAGPDGAPAEAEFVGSDAQTNLTVLKLKRLPEGASKLAPLRFGKEKLADGQLVLYISTGDATSRLGIWSAKPRDLGVVVAIDGQIMGLSREGQFLSGAACHLVADQIIRHGSVRRATLGVIITLIEKDDPLRLARPALGGRPGVRVDQVMSGSPADRAGLRAGDVILSFAGEPVTGIPGLAASVAARAGQTPISVLREDRVMEMTVELRPQ